MGEKGPFQSFTSFILGAAMAVACIVFYMSAYPKGERWDGADIQSLKVMNEEQLALAKVVHNFSLYSVFLCNFIQFTKNFGS